MKKSILIRGLTALAVCGLILSVVASSKHPVERPFKASGIVTDNTGNAMEVVGTATHLGKFISKAHWEVEFDPSNPSIPVLHVWAEFRAANGDILEAEFPAWALGPAGPADSGVATITGGTGRFENASGSYVATFSGANQEVFTVEGTISY